MKLFAMIAFASIPAFAGPICRQLDAPGSGYTQGFQINDAGQIAFGTDVGGFIYSGGAWELLPTPPGSAQSDFVATGINDLGTVAGAATGAGFLFRGGSYSFFRYPSDYYTSNLPRTVNDNGLVLGEADHFEADGSPSGGVGYIYNPGAKTAYASGFTLVNPFLGSVAPASIILGNMNHAGKFVGSGRYPRHGVHGFVFDPASGYSFFTLADGSAARPRGINDKGEIAGGAYTADWISQGFFRDANGVETRITCPELNAPNGVFVSSLNNNGLMAGDVFDAQGNLHGLVVYPSAAAALADLEGAVSGVGPGKSLEQKIDAARSAEAQGDVAAACEALSGFQSEVKAQGGKKIDAQRAASFADEARVIAAALGCK